jgi:ribonucleoside-diphosphate reductase alpha chain
MGEADLFSELGLEWDSEDAMKLRNYLSWFISFMAWQESIVLADERGVFPLYDKDKVNLDVLRNVFNSEYVPEGMKFDIDNMRVRNISVTSIAPTGSIALLAGVNSSIEPYFALAYRRNITEGVGNTAKDYVIEINRILFRKLVEAGLSTDDIDTIKKHIEKYGTLENCENIPDNIRKAFKTSHEIHWKSHIDAQASWQDYVSNAVSKTINCANSTTVEEILQMYQYMWESNLKGGTIYRDGSKSFQILNVGK